MRIKLTEWARVNGIELTLNAANKVVIDESPALLEVLERATYDDTCPALCDDGCEVEPDGRCEHGAPSLLLACGVI